jgi:Zn-finger nucleic acid-binding protein
MRCPHDQTNLSIRDTEGHIGFVCLTCRGAWLPEKYLQSIQYTHTFSYADFMRAVEKSTTAPTESKCPSGCGTLKKTSWLGASINRCEECHGVWFDRGEVQALLAQLPRVQASAKGTAGYVAGDIGANTLMWILIAWMS